MSFLRKRGYLNEAVSPEQKAMSKHVRAYLKKHGVKASVTGASTKGSWIRVYIKGDKVLPDSEMKKMVKSVYGSDWNQSRAGNIMTHIISMTVSDWSKFLGVEV